MKLNTYPDDRKVLSTKCVDIPQEHLSEFASFIDTMKRYADNHPTCVGLSANQVWKEDGPAPRVFIMAKFDGEGGFKEFINPTIHGSGKTIKRSETCLSFPEKIFVTKRSKNCTIHYLDIDGKEHVEKYGAQYSIIIQHEMDHLNGKIFKREYKG